MSESQTPGANPNQISSPSADSSNELSLKDIIGIIIDDWKLVGIVAFVILCIGVFHLWRSTPIYKVDALVQVEEKGGDASALFGEAGAMFEVSSPAQAEIEIIKSRMVLGKAVDNLHLDILVSPKYFPLIGKSMARGKKLAIERSRDVAASPEDQSIFTKYAWGGEQVEVSYFDIPESWKGKAFILEKSQGDDYKVMVENGMVLLEGRAGQVSSVELVGGTTVSLVVDKLQARAGTQFILKKVKKLKAISSLKSGLSAGEKGKKSGMLSLSYMNPSPEKAAEILNEVVNLYVRQNIDRKSEEAAKTLSFLQNQLPELKMKVDQAENKLNAFRLRTGTVDLTQEASLTLTQSVDVETKIVELKQKQQDLLRLYKDTHPNVQALKAQIAQLLAQRNSLNRTVKKLPKNQQQYLQLSRDAKVANEMYTNMLNNAQQLQVVKAGEIGNVRIVDTALPSLFPVKPNKKSGAVLSLMLGIFVGVAIALFRRLWNRGVEDPNLVEKKLGLGVYATIPHSKMQENLHKRIKKREKEVLVLAQVDKQDLAVESFKSLRTTLHFSMMDASNNIILLAGPTPGMGKSFVSTNFASTLAEAGNKVLLIDGDMRRGHLQQYFGKDRKLGLADILAGQVSFEEVQRDSGINGLDFISTGTIPPNPAELLLGARFSVLLEKVSGMYDYVLIDAPPVLAVTDAQVISKHAGTTLMLLKSGIHPMREIELCKQRLDQAGASLKGVVFNDVQISSSRYGYGKYVYQYGYGK